MTKPTPHLLRAILVLSAKMERIDADTLHEMLDGAGLPRRHDAQARIKAWAGDCRTMDLLYSKLERAHARLAPPDVPSIDLSGLAEAPRPRSRR